MESGRPHADLSVERLLIFAGPVLALGLFTAVLAATAALFDWHRSEMLIAATAVGLPFLAASLALLYRQSAVRRDARHALHNAEARVGAIIETAMDAIITVNEAQRVVLFNAAAEKVFGYSRDAVLGQSLDRLLPQRLRSGHGSQMRRFGETGTTARRMGDKTVLMGLRADGGEFPIEASISHLEQDGHRLYTVILRDVTERVRADDALRHSREELQELAAAAHSVREQEKGRIARELHDELGQGLTALKMDIAWLAERLSPGEQAQHDKLAGMQAMLDGTVAATRRISADLRPLILDDLGLVPAAEWLAQNFTQRTGVPCEFAAEIDDLPLEHNSATAVFRMLQESLTNIARHAGATQVEVTLEREEDSVLLTVRDNGRGFAAGDPRKPGSYGLLGLKERTYLLGGRLEISSSPGEGTTVKLRIPFSTNPAEIQT
jgi:PAS domain S-box-containing protein